MIWSFSFSQQYTNYSINNGLPSNHVYRITQDYDGFIWIITDKGISKFDGENFKNFTIKEGLPSNDIWNIRITPDNKIWYFSKANKLGYILNNKVFSFSSKTNKVMYPRTILQSKNTISFNDGINYLNLKDSIWKTTPNKFLKGDVFSSIQKVINTNTTHHTINRTNDSLILYSKEKETKHKINKNLFKTLYEHGQINDSLYINIGRNNYLIENFNTKQITSFSYISQNLAKEKKYFRFHNVNNKIQLTGADFVGYLGKKYSIKDIIHIPKKLNSHFSFIDKTGNIWSATFNKGIFMLPKEKQLVKILAKNKKIQFLKKVQNKLYAGIYKEGFFQINQKTHLVIKNKHFQYSITPIDTLKTTFFSSEYDVYSYNSNKKTLINIPIERHNKNEFARKLIDFKGFLYGNNSFGIRKINIEKLTTEKIYKLNGVTSFSKTKIKLFTGNQSGLFLFKNDNFIKLNKHSLFDKPILCQNQLNSNYIIVGTDGYGAYITNGEDLIKVKNTEKYNVQDIFIEKNKNIWLATQKGVHKVIKYLEKYIITKSFYKSDGLLSNNINCITVKNDSLYTGTDNGISVISLQQAPINQLQKIHIKSLLLNDISYKTDTISTSYKSNGLLAVSFGSINYSDQQNLIYQYKLEPIQNNWITTNTTELNFTTLKPDTYSLHLKVNNHHKHKEIKTITIKINPLWWQTTWFKIGVFLLLVFCVYLFNKWTKYTVEKATRKNILKKQKDIEYELYALRSQMNPHFVFNSLNAIQYYITKNEIELSEKYLVKFSRLIRMFFDFSREKNITLEQEMLLLKSYLEIEKMRFGDDFKFNINVDKSLNIETKIPTMLLQPIVENAVNHGLFHKNGDGTIDISVKKSTFKNEFIIAIKDNGVGLKKSKEIQKNSIKKHTSRSTLIIANKIKLINKSLQWHITQEVIDLETKNTSGTLVLLTFKEIKNDKSNIS